MKYAVVAVADIVIIKRILLRFVIVMKKLAKSKGTEFAIISDI